LSKLWKILSIDDDPIVHKAIKKELQYHFEIYTAKNGKQGITLAEELFPDIILLDVEMPGLNGYEVCDQLKHNSELQQIPVIFLSSLCNLRSRMLGYEAGGIDFLVKPFVSGELIAKLESIIENIKHKNDLSGKAELATNTAFSAMRDSNNLLKIIKFVEHSYKINTFSGLAESFFELTKQFNLHCSLLFSLRNERIFYAHSGGHCTSLESEVIATIYDKGGRFVDFGCRTQISFNHVALLIKNMPLSDRELYGRYKDFFPPVLSAMSTKIKSLETEINIQKQTLQLAKAFEAIKKTLLSFGETLGENQKSAELLLSNMLHELEVIFPGLGLEEDQENSIFKIIDETLISVQNVVDTSETNNKTFNNILAILESISSQNDIVSLNDNANDIEAHKEDEIDDDLSGDIELF